MHAADNLMIHEVDRPVDIRSNEIRVRAERAHRFGSRLFVASVGNTEVGYLAFDDLSRLGIGVIYEVLVLVSHRRVGVGTALIEFGENLARTLGCSVTRLEPKAFDATVDQDWLEAYYRRLGYSPKENGGGDWEKVLDA